MPGPLKKWAKRNTHSDPPPHPSGAIKVAATSPSTTPTQLERRNKQVSFFSTISGFSAFYHEKCRTSLLCLLNLFLCHTPPMKNFGIRNMYEMFPSTPLKDRNQIVQQRWALQQKVAKAIGDKRCLVAGLLPLKTQVKAGSCFWSHASNSSCVHAGATCIVPVACGEPALYKKTALHWDASR